MFICLNNKQQKLGKKINHFFFIIIYTEIKRFLRKTTNFNF